MTPKEKALKLCQKFGYTTLFAKDCNDGVTLPLRISKQCALIAVDEILFVVKQYNHTQLEFKYFNEVKDEIEKL